MKVAEESSDEVLNLVKGAGDDPCSYRDGGGARRAEVQVPVGIRDIFGRGIAACLLDDPTKRFIPFACDNNIKTFAKRMNAYENFGNICGNNNFNNDCIIAEIGL